MLSIEERIKERARALGFELVGIAPATEADGVQHLRQWLGQGVAGQMSYKAPHPQGRRQPRSVLPEVRSVVMVGMNYFHPNRNREAGEQGTDSITGRVARYARGEDYHDVLKSKLKALLGWLQEEVRGCRGRAVVDTAPLLERD